MRLLTTILLFIIPAAMFARKVSATVISNQINAANAQATYTLVAGDTLSIPVTATAYVNIGNIIASAGAHIVVIGEGPITASGAFTFFELSGTLRYVDFVFKNGTGYGMTIPNATYRAMSGTGKIQDCSFYGIDIYGGADYGIYLDHSRNYTGSLDDINYGNTFTHCRIRKTAGAPVVIGFGAGHYWQNTTFDDLVIDSINSGTCLALEWNFDVEVKNSSFTNTGLTETGHSAVIYNRGNGSFHGNYIYNHWGNGLRSFGISLVGSKGEPMGDVKFYNNVVFNSRKYDAMEANTQPGDTSGSWIRPVNYYMDNNTVGEFNAADYYTGGGSGGGGAAFDIYYGFGLTKIRNNIYFNCYRDKGQGISGLNYLWHNGNSGATVDTANNIYSTDGLSLLSDLVNGYLKAGSPAIGAGLTLSYITTDKAGRTRTVPYTVGAYNFFTPGGVLYLRLPRKQ